MTGRRIGWMGGTFDPVHNVHLILAQTAKEQLALDEVWWIPAAQSPHKAEAPQLSAAERAALVQLAIAPLDGHRLMDLESGRSGYSYTMDTVEYALRLEQGVSFYLILGADQVHALPRWHRIGELMALVRFVRTARPGYLDPFEAKAIEHWPQAWRERLVSVDMPQLDVSSTAIRQRLAEGKTVAGWVPEPVRIRIEERGLYVRSTREAD